MLLFAILHVKLGGIIVVIWQSSPLRGKKGATHKISLPYKGDMMNVTAKQIPIYYSTNEEQC